MKVTHLFMALLAIVLLASCESKPSETVKAGIDAGNVSTFDPANSVVPFPVDLLFQGTTDGTLNIPVVDPADLSDPQVALNALDGFSTSAPISTGFVGAIDPASISSTSVRMFEVTESSTPGGAVVNLNAELTFGVDFVATVSSIDDTKLVILPLKPLKPKTSYEVVITSGLKDAKGNAMQASTTYALAKGTSSYYTLPSGPRAANLPAGFASFTDAQLASLEGLRKLISTSESFTAAQASPALTTSDIILSWSFTTQSIDDVLSATRTEDRALATTPTVTAGFSPTVAAPSPLGRADIHVGFLQVPYYLTAPSSTTDTASLYKHWEGAGGSNLTQYNANPVATSTQTIPMLVSIPKTATGPCAGGMPGAGWPVVIFQHGITRNRTDMMAVADSLASACMAVVAIDLPLHGLTGLETDGTQAFRNKGGAERTFDLDVLTQDPTTGNVTANASDGGPDSSGSNFINLSNLLETRDNLRQGISDLFVLVHNIQGGAVTDGSNTFDSSKIYFLGHSLGAIVGTPFLALESNVRAAVLANGGSEVAKILDGSATFGPVISGGLAANGVIKGTSDYEGFLGAAQGVMDSADPVNYSLNASGYAPSAAAGRGLLFFEVVGDSVLGNPSDLVVPNIVPDSNDASGTIPAPLAGTEPQIALLGLTQVSTAQSPTGSDLLLTTKYTAGYHGSILDPSLDSLSNADATTEMQTELTSFLAGDGKALLTSSASATVLQAP
jgi:pimeloyl-ACP methyl ester carboxylesterase